MCHKLCLSLETWIFPVSLDAVLAVKMSGWEVFFLICFFFPSCLFFCFSLFFETPRLRFKKWITSRTDKRFDVTYIDMPSFDFTFLFFFVTFLSYLFSFFCCAGSNFSRYRGPHLRVDPDSVYFLSRHLSLPLNFRNFLWILLFLLLMRRRRTHQDMLSYIGEK